MKKTNNKATGAGKQSAKNAKNTQGAKNCGKSNSANHE